MVHYAVGGGATSVFDPAVGEGAFFRAAKGVARELGRPLRLEGTEIDPDAIRQALASGLEAADVAHVAIRDFMVQPPSHGLDAVVANPPYIRHHRLSAESKAALRLFGRAVVGTPLDGRTGYHVYFLLRALTLLSPGARLSFIMPADTVEGVFAPVLWQWIARHYRIDAVVTFAPAATPFPGVDTNAIVFMIRNAPPEPHFRWVRCVSPESVDLARWAAAGFEHDAGAALQVQRRALSEAIATGLSRPPSDDSVGEHTLADVARVVRGIATGDNNFFFLTRCQAAELAIPAAFLRTAIGRTRDLVGDSDEVTPAVLDQLDAAGRPTLLFSPDGRSLDAFPAPVARYLDEGAARGLPQRALIASRRPWYKMETRTPPPFLFAYLGRRNARFIRNRAAVVPLTGFLCVYPLRTGRRVVEQLGQILAHPATVANLARVGKSYGDGAIKVEPRALERLPLPTAVVRAAGMAISSSPTRQLQLVGLGGCP